MSGPLDDFLTKVVGDCVNGSSGDPFDEIQPGGVVWVYARGYWRQARVTAKKRRTATVSYYIRATSAASASLKMQDLPAWRFRLERPLGSYGVVDAPAPPWDGAMGAAS